MSERMVDGVRLSNPGKVLYPEQGITKGELADYYVAVAEHMLPHVAFRPITVVRCPTGRQQKCFYQRHAGAGLVKQVERIKVPGFDNPYLFIRDLPGLLGLVQMGVLEIHPWAVRMERPELADRIIFDLDPDEDLGFAQVVVAAEEVRDRLRALDLQSFVKTTGGKGLHVVAPIRAEHDLRHVKRWARAFSEAMAADAPERYLIRMSKEERAGRIFIDYLRNDVTATAVAPYSTRSRPAAPVATPLFWHELKETLVPAALTIRTVPPRLAGGQPDPWADMPSIDQPLPPLFR